MADIETIETVQSQGNDVHQRPKTTKSVILEERDDDEKVSKKPGSKFMQFKLIFRVTFVSFCGIGVEVLTSSAHYL